jgi:hypothetical protein
MKTIAAIQPVCADLSEGEIFVPVITSRWQMQVVLSLMRGPKAFRIFDAWMALEKRFNDPTLQQISNWN